MVFDISKIAASIYKELPKELSPKGHALAHQLMYLKTFESTWGHEKGIDIARRLLCQLNNCKWNTRTAKQLRKQLQLSIKEFERRYQYA